MNRKLLRLLLGLFAIVALLGACGGDDDDSADDPTTTEADDAADDGGSDDGATDDAATDEGDETSDDDSVCSLLELSDLSDATGADFSVTEPGDDGTSCVYSTSDETAVIALNVATLDGKTAEQWQTDASALCDEGSQVEVDFDDVDAGFACVAGGVPTVAASGEGAVAVLTGLTLDESVGTDQILEALATILGNAISGG